MQVEVALPNRDGTLLPGAFVQVALPLAASGALTMPTNDADVPRRGHRVAVVDAQGKVRLRPVRVGRNYGETFEVLDGVRRTDRWCSIRRTRWPTAIRCADRADAAKRREGPASAAALRRAPPARALLAGLRGRPGLRNARARHAGGVEGRGAVARRRPDDAAPKGPWWQRFGDPQLDALEQQALADSPTLGGRQARLAQARALLAATSAASFRRSDSPRARRGKRSPPTGR